MKKYASIQNRVLVDYKSFRDDLLSSLKQIDAANAPANKEGSIDKKIAVEPAF
jgi:hypothetical protein